MHLGILYCVWKHQIFFIIFEKKKNFITLNYPLLIFKPKLDEIFFADRKVLTEKKTFGEFLEFILFFKTTNNNNLVLL